MAAQNDEIYDQGLDWAITNGTRLHLVSTDPGLTYATVTGNDLGNAAITLGATADGTTSGRKTVCPETVITPSGTGTATHWAITDNSAVVVASKALTASRDVESGIDVTVAAFDAIEIRDAT